jgi:hypothetical protein
MVYAHFKFTFIMANEKLIDEKGFKYKLNFNYFLHFQREPNWAVATPDSYRDFERGRQKDFSLASLVW